MRFRVFMLALALLMACVLPSCKKEKQDTPPPNTEGEPVVEQGDENSEEDRFYNTHGYTRDFAVVFIAGDSGFDTARREVRQNGVTYTYDFTEKLAALAYDMGERNFRNLPSDLTTAALTEADPPEGTAVYTIKMVENGKEQVVVTDEQALQMTELSDIANLSSIIREFMNLIPVFAAGAVS